MKRTLVIIKPDGVSRNLVGEIISRFERTGLKIEALKMMQANIELLDKHYPETEKWLSSVGKKVLKMYKEYKVDTKKELGTADPVKIGKMVKGWTIKYIMEDPVVVMILSGYHAVENVRKLSGYTYPLTADVGSIRGDFCLDSPMYANLEKRAIRNLVHASESSNAAEFEIKLWFPEDNYK